MMPELPIEQVAEVPPQEWRNWAWLYAMHLNLVDRLLDGKINRPEYAAAQQVLEEDLCHATDLHQDTLTAILTVYGRRPNPGFPPV